jgi:hypothetical protein
MATKSLHAGEQSQQASSSDLHDAIARHARELWELRGRGDGHAEEDWLQAEAEVRLAESLSAEAGRHRAHMKVRVGNAIYLIAYERGADYTPGELRKGQRLPIRIEQDWMYIRLSKGRELAARILEKSTPAADPRDSCYLSE